MCWESQFYKLTKSLGFLSLFFVKSNNRFTGRIVKNNTGEFCDNKNSSSTELSPKSWLQCFPFPLPMRKTVYLSGNAAYLFNYTSSLYILILQSLHFCQVLKHFFSLKKLLFLNYRCSLYHNTCSNHKTREATASKTVDTVIFLYFSHFDNMKQQTGLKDT